MLQGAADPARGRQAQQGGERHGEPDQGQGLVDRVADQGGEVLQRRHDQNEPVRLGRVSGQGGGGGQIARAPNVKGETLGGGQPGQARRGGE